MLKKVTQFLKIILICCRIFDMEKLSKTLQADPLLVDQNMAARNQPLEFGLMGTNYDFLTIDLNQLQELNN